MTEKNAIRVLGIESSCDETAVAIVARDTAGGGEILSHVVRSQVQEHLPYGGVVPELAARAHVLHLDHLIRQALAEAGLKIAQVDVIAATAGPGLIGGVLVGLTTAKSLAAALNKPLIAVNHLEAHVLTARLTDKVKFPFLVLLVSGGHSQFVLAKSVGDYTLWGTTIDDALGEAFDKVAKMLSLGHPGGPDVERLALEGDPKRFKFPRPLLKENRLDFSFSGLKTAVWLASEKISPLSHQDVADICASFQQAVIDVLSQRTAAALQRFSREFSQMQPTFVIAGGVAANKAISRALKNVVRKADAELIVPPAHLCTDNGVMVAWAGAERFALGAVDGLGVAARARWPLDEETMKVRSQ